MLHFLWREHDGPLASPPARKGFGTRLIEKTLASDAGAQVKLEFLPEGLRCAIDMPLAVEVLK
jgi:two-component sensor histidine kinase